MNDPKTCPDLAILDHVYVQALAHDGLLQSMTELGSDDIKALYPEMVYNANTYNGRAYALPFSANTVVLMFNKDILKKCGIVDKTGNAKAPTTLDELIADCEIIKSKGYTAFAQPQNSFSAMEFASYVARRGGKLVSDDYKTPYINSAEVKQAAEDWRALSKFASSKSYEEDKFYTGQDTKAIKEAIKKGAKISFDINIRLDLYRNAETCRKTVLEYLTYADIVKMSEDELVFLTEESDAKIAIEKIWNAANRAKILFVTRGAKGSSVYDRSGASISEKAGKTNAVDTTGAGDCFIGTMLYLIAENGFHEDAGSYEKYLKFASSACDIICSRKGAIESMPDYYEVEEYDKTKNVQ